MRIGYEVRLAFAAGVMAGLLAMWWRVAQIRQNEQAEQDWDEVSGIRPGRK